jgi:hypothetical protein
MTNSSMRVEHIARAFPSPDGSRPARSLTYQCGGHIYRTVIGQPRRQCEAGCPAGCGRATRGADRASGNTVLSIVATQNAIEVWSREPALDWPNPSLVAPDAVLAIDYLDNPDALAS